MYMGEISLEVSIFSVWYKLVYEILYEDDTWPVFMLKKQVSVSSVINKQYVVFSETTVIDSAGSFEKSLGFI